MYWIVLSCELESNKNYYRTFDIEQSEIQNLRSGVHPTSVVFIRNSVENLRRPRPAFRLVFSRSLFFN